MSIKIVVRFKDRSIVKGTIKDELTPNTEHFELIEQGTSKRHFIQTDQLKAVFFVKNFEGQLDSKKKPGFYTTHAFGIKTVVKFHDNEVLYGFSLDYSPYTKGFFMLPAQDDTNNLKIFIPNKSVLEIKIGDDIDKSKYGQAKPKFLKRIIPKIVHITIQILASNVPLDGATITFIDSNQTFTMNSSQGGIMLSLKPGMYNVKIVYQKHSIQRQIEARPDNRLIRIDLNQIS